MKHRIIHKRRIRDIKELTRVVHVSGHGAEAVFATEKIGFGALLDPGFDIFFLGATNPGFKPGQAINLILEGIIPDASTDSPDKGDSDKDAPDRG